VKPGLSTDIDSIVSMAMRTEPGRRYVSAAALADDIRRHLGNFPVVARRDTLAYQVGRFVRRHRAMVITASIASLALFTASAVAFWQSREARAQRAVSERRFAEARKIANSMVFELHDEIARIPGTTKARTVLLGRASEWLDTLAKDAPDDPALAAELAAAYQQLGNAQGGVGEANTGDGVAALASQRKALALRERLVALAPDNPEYGARLVAAQIDMAYAVGPAEALTHAQHAVALAQRLESEAPGDLFRKASLGRAYYAEGSVLVQAGDLRGAEGVFQEAAETFQAVLLADPTKSTAQRNVSLVNKRLGAIADKEGRTAPATAYYERALAADRALVALDPASFQSRYDLSVSYVALAGVKQGGKDARGAREQYREARAIREELLQQDPANALARQALASVLSRLGAADEELGDHQTALASLARAEGLLREDEEEMLADLRSRRSVVYRSLGRNKEALNDARRAVDGRRSLAKSAPGNPRFAESLAWDLLQLGNLLAATATTLGRHEACDLYTEASQAMGELEQRQSKTNTSLEPMSESLRTALGACISRR
jgi:tetratricopeptide (TPR) repeat protein